MSTVIELLLTMSMRLFAFVWLAHQPYLGSGAQIRLIEQSPQCPPPLLDRSITVKGLKSGNFNSNFYSFAMASKTLAIGLYKVWAHRVCFAKPSLKF
jgi:hypothetical protein